MVAINVSAHPSPEGLEEEVRRHQEELCPHSAPHMIKPQSSQGAEAVAINVSAHPSPEGLEGEVLRHQEQPCPPRLHLQKKVNH